MNKENIGPLLLSKGYQLIDYINKGGFGSCYLVHSLKYNMDFACKISHSPSFESKISSSYSREVSTLIQLNHTNIVRVYDVFIVENYLAIILEYCPKGSILSKMDGQNSVPITKLIKYTYQMLDALCFIHSKGIAHSDIKPGNILLDDFDRIKICDFGLCQFANHNESNSMTFCGSTNYMAPEILMNTKYDPFKADVWSLGVTLYQMLSGKLPFVSTLNSYRIEAMKIGHERIMTAPRNFNNLLDLCLRFDPHTRPSMFQIKKYFDDNFGKPSSSKLQPETTLFRRSAQQSIIKISKRVKQYVENTVC